MALNKAKKKLDEIPNLKKLLKECEERCDEYMEKTIDQESMLESLPSLKKRINDGKDKIGTFNLNFLSLEKIAYIVMKHANYVKNNYIILRFFIHNPFSNVCL